MKRNVEKAIEAAMTASAPDGGSWLAGKSKFESMFEAGFNQERALDDALTVAAPDGGSWLAGKAAFHESLNGSKRNRNIVLVILAGLVIWASYAYFSRPTDLKTSDVSQNQTQTQTQTQPTASDEKFVKELESNGWADGAYVIGNVDPSKDKSIAGNGAYNEQGARSPAEISTMIKNGSASKLLGKIKSGDAKATDIMLANASNWRAVQSNVAFSYPGNTFLDDGSSANAGAKDGYAGEIFLLFINPITGQPSYVRGACANPQTIAPKPVVVTKTNTIVKTVVEFRDRIVNVPKEIVKWKTVYIDRPVEVEVIKWRTKYVYIHDKDEENDAKDNSDNVLENDDIDDYKRGGGASITNDGEKLQEDPETDAQDAADAADATSAEHDTAVDNATTVNSNQSKTVTPIPSW